MASDRRLRSTSSQRGAVDLARRGRAKRGQDLADGAPRLQQRGPRPDGLPRSLRAAATGRSENVSSRRVSFRPTDGRGSRGRSRWRPYAPGTASTQEWWGPELFGDSRPLVTELSSQQLAEEALTALRADRAPAPEEPWLLDMEAITQSRRSVPRHAAGGSRKPSTPPRPDIPSRPSTTPRHRRPATTGRWSAARAGWIAAVGVAVAMTVGLGWTVAFGAHDLQPGPGTEVPVPVTAPSSSAPTREPALTADPAASTVSPRAGARIPSASEPSAADNEPAATMRPTAATPTRPGAPAQDAPPAVVVTLG